MWILEYTWKTTNTYKHPVLFKRFWNIPVTFDAPQGIVLRPAFFKIFVFQNMKNSIMIRKTWGKLQKNGKCHCAALFMQMNYANWLFSRAFFEIWKQPVTSGVPQGSLFSPLLFATFLMIWSTVQSMIYVSLVFVHNCYNCIPCIYSIMSFISTSIWFLGFKVEKI